MNQILKDLLYIPYVPLIVYGDQRDYDNSELWQSGYRGHVRNLRTGKVVEIFAPNDLDWAIKRHGERS